MVTTLYAYREYVTDKQSFAYDESGARIGETPNIAINAGTPEMAIQIVDALQRPSLRDAINQALLADDLDGACLPIQNAIGQTDGGVAGMFFSGKSDEEWRDMNRNERLRTIKNYIECELSWLGDEDEQ